MVLITPVRRLFIFVQRSLTSTACGDSQTRLHCNPSCSMLTAHPPATDHTDHSQMPGPRMFNRRDDSRGAQPHHSPGQMNEQFRQSSLDSPSGYGPGHTSRGELRDESQEPYRISRVAKGTPNLGQTGDFQPKGGYYSQQEIDNWEVDPSSQWTGG